MAPPDRLERLTDLVLVLLNATTPVTLDELARSVPGYPESHDARRQAFERDKRLLREEGIPVVTVPVEGPDQAGYRIDADAFYLPELGLAADEQAALHLAVAGVHLGDPSGRDALAKLGALGVGAATPVAALDPPPALVPLYAALRSSAVARFTYHGEGRQVSPATLRFHRGRWYLAGFDAARAAGRLFRVDRIEGEVEVGPAGSSALPEGFDAPGAPLEPWRRAGSDEDDYVLVFVDRMEASRMVAEVGDAAVVEQGDDGSVVVRLGVWNVDVLRSWVLGFGEHAVVVGPPPVRAAMVEWLGAMTVPSAAELPAEPPAGAGHDVGNADAGTPVPPSAAPRRPTPASARLRRLLAVVAWLAEVGETTIAEVSTRFDIPQDEVVRELELAACCGVPPYTPDVLLEILITRDTVHAFLPKDLARPRRLTPAEGLALAASARTILAVPGADGDGPLARALTKLEAVLGDHGRLVIDLDAPPLLEPVRAALADGVQVEIEYHSASSGITSWRTVEPLAVVSLDGRWYLDAWWSESGGVRRFRIDRISDLRVLEVPVSHTDEEEEAGRPERFVPGPGAAVVHLVLAPEARWVVDTVPVLSAEPGPDGSTEVRLAVGGLAWLERLLLQLGPHARVLGPPDLAGLGAAAAVRLLQHYH